MQIVGVPLKEIPKSVKSGIIFLYAAWSWLSVTVLLFNSNIFEQFLRLLICGIILCLLIVRWINWARWLCLLCNVMALIYCTMFAMHLFRIQFKPEAVGAYFIAAILYFISSYFLAIPETARFYRAHSEKKREEEN